MIMTQNINNNDEESKDFFLIDNKGIKPEAVNGVEKQEISLEQYLAENEIVLKILKEKSDILYYWPVYKAQFFVKNGPINGLPLGNFINLNSNQELELRRCLFNAIPFLRKYPQSLRIKHFETVFEPSLKETINSELLAYYHNFLNSQFKE